MSPRYDNSSEVSNLDVTGLATKAPAKCDQCAAEEFLILKLTCTNSNSGYQKSAAASSFAIPGLNGNPKRVSGKLALKDHWIFHHWQCLCQHCHRPISDALGYKKYKENLEIAKTLSTEKLKQYFYRLGGTIPQPDRQAKQQK